MIFMRPLISVVDDDDSVRESLPDLLGELGAAVQAFASAEEFLASNYVDQTKCLLLDIAMPGMSGPELQRELLARQHNIPIVFMLFIVAFYVGWAFREAGRNDRLIEQGKRDEILKDMQR